MNNLYAIISFRKSGPMKSFAALRGAQIHNSREKPILHAERPDVAPRHLVGSGDLVADVRKVLQGCGIDPRKLRKNGVIAYEAILTASPEFFVGLDEASSAERLEAWIAQQHAFVHNYFGSHRVVSLVVHLDELTPHAHVVVLPLVMKTDGRRSDGGLRWALVGRDISGPGEFDKLQDEYAAAMAVLGLSRGRKASGQSHLPVRDYRDKIAGELAAATLARADVERARAQIEWEMEDVARLRQSAREAWEQNEELVAANTEEMKSLMKLRWDLDESVDAMRRTIGRAVAFLTLGKKLAMSEVSGAVRELANAAFALVSEVREERDGPDMIEQVYVGLRAGMAR